MSANRIACGSLLTLAVALGCTPKPEPAPDVPKVVIAPQPPVDPPVVVPVGPAVAPMPRPAPVIAWVPGTKQEQAELVSHIPDAIRKLFGEDADYKCFQSLEGHAIAWEYTGGPVRMWLEFEEKGQSTVPKRYPAQEDWLLKGETGRVIFWIRRGVSDKINTVLKRAGKPEGDTSAVELGVMISSPAGGLSDSVGHKNPLWYGWTGYKFDKELPQKEVPLTTDGPTAFYSLEATEVNVPEGKEPRRAKVTLKMQRAKPE